MVNSSTTAMVFLQSSNCCSGGRATGRTLAPRPRNTSSAASNAARVGADNGISSSSQRAGTPITSPLTSPVSAAE